MLMSCRLSENNAGKNAFALYLVAIGFTRLSRLRDVQGKRQEVLKCPGAGGDGRACTGVLLDRQLQTNSKAGQMPIGGVATLPCLQGEPLRIIQQDGGRGQPGFHKGNWQGCAGWSVGEGGGVGSSAIALGPGRGDT